MELFDELLYTLNASANMAIELGIIFREIQYESCLFFTEYSERAFEHPNDIEEILDDLRDEFQKQLEHRFHDILDICETNGINAYIIPRDAWTLIKMSIFERFKQFSIAFELYLFQFCFE